MKKNISKKHDPVTGYDFLYVEGDKKAIGIMLGVDPVLDSDRIGKIELGSNDELVWVPNNDE
jgi:hypothetical protein